MRFFEVVLSGAALVSSVFAAVEFTSFPTSEIAAGESVTLTYTPEDVATTIILRKGPSTDLDTLETLTTTSTGGSFTWNVPFSLEDGDDYAFEIRQEGDVPNYSGQFGISGGSAPAPSVESSAGYSTAEPTSAEETSTAEESSAPVTSAYTTLSTTAAPSASATISPSGSNSTISLGTPSATGTASPTSGEPPIENTGAASSFGVNAAALFGAMGAFAYFV